MAQRKRTLLPIGIHLDQDAVHMAQLDQADGQVRVVSKASRYFTTVPDSVSRLMEAGDDAATRETAEARYAEARRFVRQKLATDGFRGKDAVITVPSEHLAIQHLRLQPMGPEELASAIPYEVQGKLPFDPQDAIIRPIVAGTVSENNETKQDVLVLAVRRPVVEKNVAAFTRMGLRVVGVGVVPCAMCYAYAFAATHAEPTQGGPPCLMLVYLGGQTTHVAIVRGQDVTFVKGVEQGLDGLIAALSKAKKLSLEEAATLLISWRESKSPETSAEAVDGYNSVRHSLDYLTDEIRSCMRYHASLARGARIDRLCFVGPGARDRALVRVLSANMPIDCEAGDPLGVVMQSPEPERAEPEMAVAVGLSLFGAN